MDTMLRSMLMLLINQFGGEKVFGLIDEIVKGKNLSIEEVDQYIMDNPRDFSHGIDLIPRIKAVRQLTGMGLVNSKVWVEEHYPDRGRIY